MIATWRIVSEAERARSIRAARLRRCCALDLQTVERATEGVEPVNPGL